MESLTNWHFLIIGMSAAGVLCLLVCVILLVKLWSVGVKCREAVKEREVLLEVLRQNLRTESDLLRREIVGTATDGRKEAAVLQNHFSTQLMTFLNLNAEHAKGQLDSFAKQLSELTAFNELKFNNIKASIEQNLTNMRQNNDNKLDEMRRIVDEKLQSTLDQRLSASFKQVSERLEQVFKGLGEMQVLAGSVGDLKRILTNVKTRGTWGEIRLGHILEQILTKDQYETNACVKLNTSERVEFAIKLPGNEEDNVPVLLPIDSKFPQEDYMTLQNAQQNADTEGCAAAMKSLKATILNEAKNISSKYIAPPRTTDFAIMFLPTEGLYAEILNIPGVCDDLQNKYRVIIAGPTTMAALLNSLQMGFRTLNIQKRSGEVWQLLSKVQSEFGKFSDILMKLEKNLSTATNTLADARRKTGTISRSLRRAETLPGVGEFEGAFELEHVHTGAKAYAAGVLFDESAELNDPLFDNDAGDNTDGDINRL